VSRARRHLILGLAAVAVLSLIHGVGVSVMDGNDAPGRRSPTLSVSVFGAVVRHEVCPEADPAVLPRDFRAADRELPRFSRDLLGVQTTFEGRSGRSLDIISGGYADDVAEAYDDLSEAGVVGIRGIPATLYAGTFLNVPVRMAVWRLPDVEAPCDVHAVIGTGVTETEFREVLAGLTYRRDGVASTPPDS
jgi:hypothetical protein